METVALQSQEPIRPIRKWPIVIAVLIGVALLGIYGCYRAVRAGQVEANSLGAKLHDQMRAQDSGGIYSASSAAYQKAETRAKSDALFAGIYRKLGVPTTSKQLYVNIYATTAGEIITARFVTHFSKDAIAHQTIGWRKEQAGYRC